MHVGKSETCVFKSLLAGVYLGLINVAFVRRISSASSCASSSYVTLSTSSKLRTSSSRQLFLRWTTSQGNCWCFLSTAKLRTRKRQWISSISGTLIDAHSWSAWKKLLWFARLGAGLPLVKQREKSHVSREEFFPSHQTRSWLALTVTGQHRDRESMITRRIHSYFLLPWSLATSLWLWKKDKYNLCVWLAVI